MSGKNNGQQPEERPQIKPGDLEDDAFRQQVGICCLNCAYGREALDDKGNSTGMVTCHANPPMVVGMNAVQSAREALAGGGFDPAIKPYTMWPQLHGSEWCGVFSAPQEWLMSLASRFGTPAQAEGEGASDEAS